MRTVAISGSRTFTDRQIVERVVDRLIDHGDRIIFGDAQRGVDRMVWEYVEHRADDVYEYDVYEADWGRYGKAAGHIRNEAMIYWADLLVAIFAPGPRTPGTSNAVLSARRKGVPIAIYHNGEWTVEGVVPE